MNIKDLVIQAKERISAMSGDEIRAKFIQHGYVPSALDMNLCSSFYEKEKYSNINLNLEVSASNKSNYFAIKNFSFNEKNKLGTEWQGTFYPANIACNDANFNLCTKYEMDLAA